MIYIEHIKKLVIWELVIKETEEQSFNEPMMCMT